MEENNSRQNEAVLDIESGEARPGAQSKRYNRWGNALNNLFNGVLRFNAPANGEPRTNTGNDGVALLVDNNPGGQNNHGFGDKDKERRKNVQFNKASKPPRPPKGPYLDAADMRLVKEISKLAMKKRERIERMKALKKMKAAKSLSQSSPSISSPSSSGTISALIITVLFFLVLVLQGFGSNTSSNLILVAAPQPAPETTTTATSGLTPVQFYETVLSDDGAAPGFVPPKYTE